jgi:hypothetical protein
VELGGWNMIYAWRNPPPQFLEKEIAPFADWLVWHLLISPRLEVLDMQITPLGDHNHHVRLVVQNTGWLPTYVSKKWFEKKSTRGVICEIELPEGAVLKTGKQREDIGQLEGRCYTNPTPTAFDTSGETRDRAKVEWVIHAPGGGSVNLVARHERAGVVRRSVTLD